MSVARPHRFLPFLAWIGEIRNGQVLRVDLLAGITVALAHLSERLRAAGIEILFAGVKKQVLDVFEHTSLHEKIGAECFFRSEDQALEHTWKALGNNHEADCPLNFGDTAEMTATRTIPTSLFVTMAFCEIKGSVTGVMQRTGLLDKIGAQNIFLSEKEALTEISRCLGQGAGTRTVA